MKILMSGSAIGDFEDIKKYYEKEGVPHVEKKFISSIIERIQTLCNNPDIGRMVPEFDDPKIRELIHSPFRVVYLREKTSIHVIRVWRSERMPVLPENET